MSKHFPHIFEPFTVKRTTFRNRVVTAERDRHTSADTTRTAAGDTLTPLLRLL